MAGVQCRSTLRLAAGLLLALATIGAGPARAVDAPQDPADGLHDRPVLVLDPGRHTAPIKRLDADREGRFLVTASDDKTVRVWAASDGRLLRTIRLPAGPGNVGKAYAAAISPDGTLIAAGGWTLPPESDIYLFDRASGRLRHRVGGLPNVVRHLAFSPKGSRLAATLGGRNGVRLIDPASGRVVAEDTEYGDESYGAAFDVAGRLATTSLDGKLRLYDPAGRTLRTEPAPGGNRPFGLAFSPDGKRLAVGYTDSTRVDVLDGASLKPLLTPDGTGVDNGNLGRVAWSADGSSLYAAGQWQVGGESRLRRWLEGGRRAPVDVALSRNTVMSLRPLPEGRLAFAATDPRLGVLGGDGRERWSLGPAGADFRDQLRTLAVSADGVLVRFGYEPFGRSPTLLRLAERRLVPEGSAKGLATARVEAPGLAVEGWENGTKPRLNGKPLALDAYERARSLAIAPDGQRFVLGSEWALRLFDSAGTQLWQRTVPGIVWAVNVSGDERLVVAAYGDGTIRWHRLEDGEELLAFYPLADKTNWVAWTPDGFYAATPGAYGVLRWHVNHGRDEAAESIAVSEIPKLRRPDVLPLVLQEMDIVRALGLADLAEARRAVQARTGSSVPPGAQLHVLAIGVSNYNEEHAKQLRLQYADRDAWDIASALLNTQTSLYAEVKPQILRDGEATRAGIIDGLDAMRKGMAAGSGRDMAVVNFSGHGAVVDNKLYLLPYDVDSRTPAKIRGSAISAEELRDELAELGKLGRVLVLLDSCHSGAATDGTDLAADATILRTALAASNVTVLTSSSGKEVSIEKPAWGNGAFTQAFLEALGRAGDSNADSLVSVDELMAFLGSRVRALTEGAQTPGVEVRYQGGLFAAGL